MKAFPIRTVLAITVLAAGAGAAQAATVSQLGSGVDAYFGSQGTGYTNSNPTNPFPGASPGPLYSPGSPLAGVPTPPTPMVYPTYSGNPFQGTPSTSTFNDGQPLASVAAAKSVIGDIFNPAGTNVADQAIDIQYWRLYQAAGALQYAYEQLNFAADYQVNTASPLLGSAPSIPLFVSGIVVTGGTVQFDAAITYTWADINTAGIVGAPTTLGTLTYQWNAPGGPFAALLTSSGTLAPTPLGSTAGILELTGYAYIAGDPFDITITPEPASLSLLALGALAVRRRARRQ